MNIFVVFGENKSRTYLTQCVCSTEKKANKVIDRLQKLDKKFNSSYVTYFYEEWEVDEVAPRIQVFLEKRKQ